MNLDRLRNSDGDEFLGLFDYGQTSMKRELR